MAAGPLLADWMSPLDGSLHLSSLTIPGTHDTCARFGGARKQTQTLDIAGQLAAGLRFFDVRLKDDAGVLRAFHDDADQQLELEAGVLGPMRGFLARHRREALIMSVKREGAGTAGDDAAFARDFEAVAARRPGDFHVGSDLPRLDAARGKIVLLRRYAGGAAGIPAGPADWADSATFTIASRSGTINVEDEWDLGLSLSPLDDKWQSVARNLNTAAGAATARSAAAGSAAAGSAPAWYVTFTSAVHDVLTPRLIAGGPPFTNGINQRLVDYLADHPGRRRLGTVVIDFPELPDHRLLQGLVDTNR